jgi:glucose/arabinose dehydrogenase
VSLVVNLKRLGAATLPVLLAVCFVALFITMLHRGDTSAATTWAPGFYSQQVVGGLTNPTAIAWTPDGRMLIALKEGKVLVHKDGQLLSTPFIDLSDEVEHNI